MDLDDIIMQFRRRVLPQRRRRSPVTWVRHCLRNHEGRSQYHNLVVKLYEDQPAFSNLKRMSSEIFTKTECWLIPDLKKQTTFLQELLNPGLKLQ